VAITVKMKILLIIIKVLILSTWLIHKIYAKDQASRPSHPASKQHSHQVHAGRCQNTRTQGGSIKKSTVCETGRPRTLVDQHHQHSNPSIAATTPAPQHQHRSLTHHCEQSQPTFTKFSLLMSWASRVNSPHQTKTNSQSQ
jgi:hypothetical protein